MILAERRLLGFADTWARLHVNLDDTFVVEIEDTIGRIEWPTSDRREAKDRYFHPFAFGYTAPEINLPDDSE